MKNRSAIYGASFLMATSAIGPGFLTATVLFTNQLGASFGFVILVSIIIDIIVQSNIWQIIALAKKPAQTIVNEHIQGAGHFMSALIIAGGFVFNMGNIAGCGLGLSLLFPIQPLIASIISAMLAIVLFLFKHAGKAMDMFSKILGAAMILLMAFVMIKTQPPILTAIQQTIVPKQVNLLIILTIVGGTIGGYISFSGAHRLLLQNITGKENIEQVKKSANTAIGIASAMRLLLFLAALGAITNGAILDKANPAASIFESAAGNVGLQIFGLVIWAASITSVVGASFTSISFATHWHKTIQKNQNKIVIAFIFLSTLFLALFDKPVKVLLFAGAANGLVLAISFLLLLSATYVKLKQKEYNKIWWVLGLCFGVLLLIVGLYAIIKTYF